VSSEFTEEEMRRALGLSTPSSSQTQKQAPAMPQPAKVEPTHRPLAKSKAGIPKLRVTLRVSKEFEGETKLFHHDADTLSRFDAEQQAVALAKKEKYRYFELIEIKSVE
jgi:hypothetical protein